MHIFNALHYLTYIVFWLFWWTYFKTNIFAVFQFFQVVVALFDRGERQPFTWGEYLNISWKARILLSWSIHSQTNLQKAFWIENLSVTKARFALFVVLIGDMGKNSVNFIKLDTSIKNKEFAFVCFTVGKDFEAFFVIPVCRITEVSSVHKLWLLKGGQVKYAETSGLLEISDFFFCIFFF